MVTIRIARDEDAALLAQVGGQAFTEAFGPDNNPQDLADYLSGAFSESIQRAEVAESGSVFFIAEDDGTPCGYARLRRKTPPAFVRGKNPCELQRFYVLKDWWGKGAAHDLMRAVVDEASRLGYGALWLGVWQKNPRAIAFYQKWGFQIVGETTFVIGSDVQHDHVMVREMEGR